MSRNRAALEHAQERWNAGDLDGYLELYDPQIRLFGYSPEALRAEEVRAFYEQAFAAFPGARLDFHDLLEDGDEIAVRFTLRGRHEGEFMGVAATGLEIALPGITILRFDGATARVVERWSNADMLGLLVQLGAMPAPA